MTGAITGYIDVAQMTLYAFWIFFFGLIFYLRREDKREGYPLVSERSRSVTVQGLPEVPAPKSFLLHDGSVVLAPRAEEKENPKLRPADNFMGAPMIPTGNPMVDGVGPAAYAMRSPHPDMMFDGSGPRLAPLRADPLFFLSPEDPDPRGMAVYGTDRVRAGTVSDVWVDRSEYIVRYLEVAVDTAAGPRPALVPMTLVQLDAKQRAIRVRSITAAQFAEVPALASPDVVTLREEDRIMGYYGGGQLYATPRRTEPLI